MLWLPAVQQRIKDIAVNELNKITNGQISIGKLRFHPFNEINLENIHVPDLKGDTLFYAQNLSARFSLSELLQHKLLIKSVGLEDFMISVSQDSINSPYNFQFLIDAFTSSDTTQSKPSSLKIGIDDISLARGRLYYNITSQEKLSEGFDFNHIHVYDFNSRISLRSIDMEELDIELKSFTLRETSGLYLKNLSGKIVSNEKTIDAKDWLLQLSDSEMKIDQATLDYTGSKLEDLMQDASYSLSLNIPKLSLTDLQAFYPPLKNSHDAITLHLESSGKFPEIKIGKIQASIGDYLSLNASGNIDDYANWYQSLFGLEIKKLTISNQAIGKISNLTTTNPQPVPTEIVQLGKIDVTGSFKGSLQNTHLDILAKSSTGNLNLNGQGGYEIDSNTGHFDIKLKSGNFDLKTLLGNPSFGIVNLGLNTKGKIINGNIQAKGEVQLNRFDFNRYSYKDINAIASYSNDNAKLSLVSKDPNLPIVMEADVNTNPKEQSIDLYARLNQVRLDTINILTDNPMASLSLALNAKVTGFNPESMEAKIAIDSLLFANKTNTIRQKPILFNYQASENNQKSATITSGIINADVQGKILLADLAQAFSNTMSIYLPAYFPYKKIQEQQDSEDIELDIDISNMENISQVLNIPFAIIEPAHIKAAYKEAYQFIDIYVDMPKIRLNDLVLNSTQVKLQTDTVLSKIHATAQSMRITEESDSLLFKLNILAKNDSVSLSTDFRNGSSDFDMNGSIALDALLTPVKNHPIPDMFIKILPTSVYINGQTVNIEPSELTIQKDYYNINHFNISLSENEFLTIDGTISNDKTDTLTVNPSHIKVQTLMQAFYPHFDLKGEINGSVFLTQLLSSPHLFTKNLTIKDIILSDKKIGTMNLSSLWNNDYKGMGIKATLTQENAAPSEITGIIFPEKDSIRLKTNINDIQLDWLTPFTQDYLYDLTGSLGVQINATGKLSQPDLSGTIAINDTRFGIKMTNTLYNISEVITITPNSLSLKDFKIVDKNKHVMTINGSVIHNNFNGFKPDIKINMRDFLLLDNPKAIDSLFYGNLKLNGSISITGSEKELLANVILSNSGSGKVFVKTPESSSQAQQFNSIITFVNPADTLLVEDQGITKTPETIQTTSLPVKLNVTLSVNPELTLGTIINPDTKDEASVSGTGNIDFSYDMTNNNMSLLGQYVVDNGKCTVSLKNITKKTFNIQQGSEVIFNGDPMRTSFNATAIYPLRADLTTLDESFKENSYLPTTRVNVNCLIKVSGSMDKMDIQYDVVLPNASEELQQQVAGLIYSDDIKIKEIAYLLALGSFWSPEGNGNDTNNMWTSLASSALSSQLNQLLSNVLNENWTIGTNLRANDESMSDLEMDVNVSTHLFNDRLTVTGNLGYRNSSLSNTNFTGDFEVDYKLTRSGNTILKMYNITNDQYYEQAPTTQGVGIAYKKEAKTFRELFRRIRKEIWLP